MNIAILVNIKPCKRPRHKARLGISHLVHVNIELELVRGERAGTSFIRTATVSRDGGGHYCIALIDCRLLELGPASSLI